MEWQGLEFLGATTVITLQELFGSPVHLANSFDGPEGAAALIRQAFVFTNTGENLMEDEAARRLVAWADTHQRSFKRAKTEMAVGQFVAPVGFRTQGTAPCDTYKEIVRGGPKIALELLKKTQKVRKGNDVAGSRAGREDQDREKYAHELACILDEARLPACC